MLFFLLVGGYVTLPWWLPADRLAAHWSAQWSTRLGRTVTIERMNMSWMHGVSIEGLAIRNAGGGPSDYFAKVEQIRCGFTPLTTMWTGRVDHLEIDGPEIHLAIDANGNLDLPVASREERGDSPTLEYTIRNAALHVSTPEVSQGFHIDQLHCLMQPERGLVSVEGETAIAGEESPSPRLAFKGAIKVPQLNRKLELKLGGEGTLEWQNLALAELPIPIAAQLPKEDVRGQTSGRVVARFHPDLSMDYDFDIALRDVRLHRHRFASPYTTRNATMRGRVRVDPATDRFVLEDIAYETAALQLERLNVPDAAKSSGMAPALSFDPKSESPWSTRLIGRVKDWALLMEELPWLKAAFASQGVALTGSAAVTLDLDHHLDWDQFTFSLQAPLTEGRLTSSSGQSRLRIQRGDINELHIEAMYDRRADKVSSIEVEFDNSFCRMLAESRAVLPANWPGGSADHLWSSAISWLTQAELDMNLKVDRLERFVELFPGWSDGGDAVHATGSAEFAAHVQPRNRYARLDVRADFSEDATLTVGDWIDKPKGQWLSLRAGARLLENVQEYVTLEDLALDVSHGDARVRSDSDDAFIAMHPALFSESPGPGGGHHLLRWRLPLLCSDVAQWQVLSPAWARLMGTAELHAWRGDVALDSTFEWLRDDAGDSIAAEASVIADRLGVRWGEWFAKPDDEPMAVRISYAEQRAKEQSKRRLTCELGQPALQLDAELTWSGSTDRFVSPSDAIEGTVRLDTLRLEDISVICPALAPQLARFEPVGSLAIVGDFERAADRWRATTDIDATRAAFTLPEPSPITKKLAGEPGVIRLELLGDYDTLGGKSRIELRSTDVQLGPLVVGELQGVFEVDGHVRTLSLNEIDIERAELRSAGLLNVSTLENRLAETFEPICAVAEIDGVCDWWIDAVALGELTSVRARLASPALRTGWGNDLAVGVVQTSEHLPFELSADVALLTPDGLRNPTFLRLNNAVLEVQGSRVRAHGQWPMSATGYPEPDYLWIDADVRDLEAIAAAFPSAPFNLSGRSRCEVKIAGLPHQPKPVSLRCEFDDCTVVTEGERLYCDGAIEVSADAVIADRLAFEWATFSGTVSGMIQRVADQYVGRLGVAMDRFDTKQALAQIESLRRRVQEIMPFHDTSGVQIDWFDELAKADVDVALTIGEALVEMPPNIPAEADALDVQVQARTGPTEATFVALVDGGEIEGSFGMDAAADEQIVRLQYRADQIQPGPLVDAYLNLQFPGMSATGALTIEEESFIPLDPGPGEFETGQGELIIEGGTLIGRAAPRWMTQFFPGLNLAEFKFYYMHSWFEKLDDGRIRHQMIFQGRYYNVYIFGHNMKDGTIDYEVGVDFLADFDSKYWADSGQGRVPLFTKTGRIGPDGKMEEEIVTYTPERLIRSLLISNTPVVTAYHAGRKRVLNEE